MSKRYVLVNKIKSEYLDQYIDAHMHMHESPFKDQLQILRDAGAIECICYIYDDLAILMYECDDIDQSFSILGQIPKRMEWEEFTGPMFANSPKFDGSAQVPYLRKIFDMNQQLDNGKLEQF